MVSDTGEKVREAIAEYEATKHAHPKARRSARYDYNRRILEIVESDGEEAVIAAFESATGTAEALRDSQAALVA